jgi:hypothetical protein
MGRRAIDGTPRVQPQATSERIAVCRTLHSVVMRQGGTMQQIEQMVSTVANRFSVDAKILARCAEACFACAATCRMCADACLGEQKIDMLRRCIGRNLDCADQCIATGNITLRSVEPEPALLRAALEACALACASCGAECRKHASMHEHCRVCADACAGCENECRALLQSLGTAGQSTMRS